LSDSDRSSTDLSWESLSPDFTSSLASSTAAVGLSSAFSYPLPPPNPLIGAITCELAFFIVNEAVRVLAFFACILPLVTEFTLAILPDLASLFLSTPLDCSATDLIAPPPPPPPPLVLEVVFGS